MHRGARLQIDDSAECVIAVQRRHAAGNNLHLVERGLRHASPEHPGTKRIVERDAHPAEPARGWHR